MCKKNLIKIPIPPIKKNGEILTLFAQKSPQALQSDLGPDGPLRIIGVDFELIPQCVQHLYIHNHAIQRDE